MKKIFLGLLVVIILSGCSYSDGKRQGQIVKLSHKGLVCKTWEGELATLSGRKNGIDNGTLFSNTFYFSVRNDEILQKLQLAMDKGKEVSLSYKEVYFRLPCEADSQYDIVDVKIIE